MVRHCILLAAVVFLVGICGSAAHSAPGAPGHGLQAAARVTAVRLEVEPSDYSGPCPAHVKLIGTITADGPGTAYYQFQAGAVGANKQGTVDFPAAGTQTVTSEGQTPFTPQVPRVRFLAGMEPRGHQENAKYVDGPLHITCAAGAQRVGGSGATGAGAAGTTPPAARNVVGGGEASTLSLPAGTKVEADFQGKPLTFKPAEQVAFLVVLSIRRLERDECLPQLGRLCTLQELVSGIPGKGGQTIGLTIDPNTDTNYQYTVATLGTNYEAGAAPRHAGLAGFLFHGGKGLADESYYFNPNGAASSASQTLESFGHSGADFRHR